MLPRQQKLVIICCLCHQLHRDLLLWVLMVFSSLVFGPFLLFLLLHHQNLFESLLQVREVTWEYLKKNRHMFVEVEFKKQNILQQHKKTQILTLNARSSYMLFILMTIYSPEIIKLKLEPHHSRYHSTGYSPEIIKLKLEPHHSMYHSTGYLYTNKITHFHCTQHFN